MIIIHLSFLCFSLIVGSFENIVGSFEKIAIKAFI